MKHLTYAKYRCLLQTIFVLFRDHNMERNHTKRLQPKKKTPSNSTRKCFPHVISAVVHAWIGYRGHVHGVLILVANGKHACFQLPD